MQVLGRMQVRLCGCAIHDVTAVVGALAVVGRLTSQYPAGEAVARDKPVIVRALVGGNEGIFTK